LSKVALKQAEGNATVSRDLETIKNSSFSIMESMSDIVWAINPANDPFDKTVIKMRQFAAAILEPAGIEYSFNENGKLADLKIGVDERKNYYLIFKEAINNIAKYSGATSVAIELHKTGQQFLMKITDNGKGFDPGKQHPGNGLKNMKNRAGEMKATYDISSGMAAGTSISVAVPLT
jgi:two-component system sensor histidine kinase UhpB